MTLIWSARLYGQFSLDKTLTLQAGATVVRNTEHCIGYFDMAIIILSSAKTAGADYRSYTSQESRQRKTAHRPLARDPADSDDDGARLLKLSN